MAGSQSAQQAARDWEAVRASGDIQFAPVPQQAPPAPPAWLKPLQEFLKSLFEPLGKALGVSWPVVQWILIGLAVLAVLAIVWRLLAPLIEAGRRPRPEVVPVWTPSHADALALLEDADRLAGEGKFDEATHLLLRRSVQQIAAVRPDWLHPASTAREIAGLLSLPGGARLAFGVIADRVERSRFALRALDLADWQAAREAYAKFALERLAA
ncbi:MAG: hypothetical protein KGL44_04920 [Sphingomonadales bacterium]|nr:hypothetical protein [Sphingomonadales bacterium]